MLCQICMCSNTRMYQNTDGRILLCCYVLDTEKKLVREEAITHIRVIPDKVPRTLLAIYQKQQGWLRRMDSEEKWEHFTNDLIGFISVKILTEHAKTAKGSYSQELQIETPLKRPFCEKAQFREKTFCLVPEAKRKWKCKTEEMSRFGGNAINFQQRSNARISLFLHFPCPFFYFSLSLQP